MGLYEMVNPMPHSKMERSVDDDGFVSPAGSYLTASYLQVIPIITKALQKVWSLLNEDHGELSSLKEAAKIDKANLEAQQAKIMELEKRLNALEQTGLKLKSH